MMKSDLLLLCSLLASTACVNAQELAFTNKSSELPATVRSSNNTMDIRSGDIDNDGDPDLVLAVEFYKNVILLNDGNGNFTNGSDRLPDKKATESPVPWRYYPYHDSEDVALEDFDNDGDLDIIIVTEDDQINEYYLNDGTGHFTDASDQIPVTGISNAVIAADFDGDGWTDIVIGNNGQNYYLKNQQGEWLNETATRLPLRKDITQDVEAVDIDGDGDQDLLIGNEKENYILENDGSGKFTDVTNRLLDPSVQENGETREADAADVDGDGLPDLYFANVTLFQGMPPVQRLLINRQGKFQDETAERLGFTDLYSVVDADFEDIDGDGDQDLIFQTLEMPRLYLNDGKGYFTDKTELLQGVSGMGIDAEVRDFNGDGRPDIYLGNFRTGDYYFIRK